MKINTDWQEYQRYWLKSCVLSVFFLNNDYIVNFKHLFSKPHLWSEVLEEETWMPYWLTCNKLRFFCSRTFQFQMKRIQTDESLIRKFPINHMSFKARSWVCGKMIYLYLHVIYNKPIAYLYLYSDTSEIWNSMQIFISVFLNKTSNILVLKWYMKYTHG